MAENGNVNMTNLKTATGVNSNDLSDHNPNGSGTQTEFGFWFIKGLDDSGNFNEDEVPSDILVGDVFSLYIEPAGSNADVTDDTHGNESIIEGTLKNGGIINVFQSNGMQLNDINYEVTIPNDFVTGVELIVEVTNSGSISIQVEWDDGGINEDVLTDSPETWGFAGSATEAVDINITGFTGLGLGIEVDYEIIQGPGSFNIDLYRGPAGGGLPDPDNDTPVAQDTVSSQGNYTITDSTADDSRIYDYIITAFASNGTADQSTSRYTP